ncbi:chondrolectin isoform X1 [Corythoichthys intestinalis]|nr:chondrolectin isoform X1 [Corythoichthys intestinalis]
MAHFHDVSSRVDFQEAELACRVDGGALVSIRTAAEQNRIETLLEDLRSGSGISDGDFWIGLTRTEGEERDGASCPQRYRWSDGSAASFRKWYPDEPSCGAESCVVMYHQPGALPGAGGAYLYRWNDDRCSMKHNFICKYPDESRQEEEEHGDGGRGADTAVRGGQVTVTGAPATLLYSRPLLYVSLPAVPLVLLMAAAAATGCCRALGRRPSATLWISETPEGDVAPTGPSVTFPPR